MSQERWTRVKDLLARALELAPEDRPAFLDRECGGDATLRAEIEALLAAAEADRQFLEPPEPVSSDTEPDGGLLARVLGDFELHEELGRGSMGVVHRARQVSLDRWVALKILNRRELFAASRLGGFQDEARKAARLRHAGIAAVHAFGESAGSYYFAMEWVPGRDLGRELERLRSVREGTARSDERAILPPFDGPDYYRRVAQACADVAAALQHAHENDIVHRDVKPPNIVLRWDGSATVVDFGIARDESFGRIASTDLLEGTPYYMSPEQVDRARLTLDHRTDVYSLGVVLYESLTLCRPFDGRTSREVIDRIARFDPRPVRHVNPRVPRDLATICGKAMARLPADRYPTARDLGDDLRRFLAHEAILATRPTLAARVGGFARRRRNALLVIACVLVAGLIGAFDQARRAQQRRAAELRTTLTSRLDEFRAAARDPRRVDPDRASRLAAASVELERASDGDLAASSSLRELVDDLRRARLAAKAAMGEAALAELERAGIATDATERFTGLARGLILLVAASHAFADDAELGRLASGDAILPRLRVRVVGDVPARVAVRRLDAVTGLFGERTELGPTPLEGPRMLPGFHRVIVEFEDGRFVELLRELPWQPAVIDVAVAPPPPASVVLRDMVLIDGAVTCFADPAFGCPNVHAATAIPSFYVDRCEVSNGEYQAYLEATGAAAPPFWSAAADGRALDAWARLPVTDVAWPEAVRYAEWAGKRLATHPEWELAARGVEGRHVPWPDAADIAPRGNLAQALAPRLDSQADRFAYYLGAAQPVRSFDDAATPLPHGVQNLYGNVSEFTESVFVHRVRGAWVVEPTERFVMGGAWNAGTLGDPMITHEFASVYGADASVSRGFRCAKSALP